MMLLFRFRPFLLPFFLLLLFFIFHIPSANSQDLPLYVICDNTASYTSTFGTNLKQLFSSLSSNSSLNNGFYNTSIGRDSNTTYGLTLCRGDVEPKACETCIKTAGDEILGRCPNKSATIWYDNCFLRYSNNNFLGRTVTPVWISMSNTQNVSSDPDRFEKTVGDLMNNLARTAANEPWLRMFATGVQNFSSFSNLYGLVQCVRDLSANDCLKCLGEAIGQIPTCCDKKRGGRVFGALCGVRYEEYSFFGASKIAAPAPSPPPPTPSLNPNTTSPSTNGTTTDPGKHL